MERGPASKPPPGFADSLDFCGRQFSIEYFETITCPEDGDLDGRHIPNHREIWIATKGRHPDHIADTLWHEVAHAVLAYVEDGSADETIVLTLELTQPAILRANPWFLDLFRDHT